MTAEEIKEEAHRIATSIFYSPATNGKAEPSINDGYNKIMAFAEAYANQWVKAEDRGEMPGNGMPVLVHLEDKRIIFPVRIAQYWLDHSKNPLEWTCYDHNGVSNLKINEVTHWMPLPNPPKP